MTHTEVTSLIYNLLAHTRSLLVKLKSEYPHEITLMKILLSNEQALLSDPIDIDRLRGNNLGIYRMIEPAPSNPLEEEMMKLHDEIYELLKALREQKPQK